MKNFIFFSIILLGTLSVTACSSNGTSPNSSNSNSSNFDGTTRSHKTQDIRKNKRDTKTGDTKQTISKDEENSNIEEKGACRNSPHGCEFQGNGSDLTNHEKTCTNYKCKNTGCDFKGSKSDIDIHQPKCTIGQPQVSCINSSNGCKFQGNGSNLTNHEKTCTNYKCKNTGCDVKGSKSDIEDHEPNCTIGPPPRNPSAMKDLKNALDDYKHLKGHPKAGEPLSEELKTKIIDRINYVRSEAAKKDRDKGYGESGFQKILKGDTIIDPLVDYYQFVGKPIASPLFQEDIQIKRIRPTQQVISEKVLISKLVKLMNKPTLKFKIRFLTPDSSYFKIADKHHSFYASVLLGRKMKIDARKLNFPTKELKSICSVKQKRKFINYRSKAYGGSSYTSQCDGILFLQGPNDTVENFKQIASFKNW